jgi:MFS superfamily sulfate permease-like transporter
VLSLKPSGLRLEMRGVAAARHHRRAPLNSALCPPPPPSPLRPQWDLLAGITVGFMVVPQGMSYATLAGGCRLPFGAGVLVAAERSQPC